MVKLLKIVIKKLVLAITLIYSFNILVSSFNLNVAVNPYSIGVVYFTGIPGMISLVIIKFLIK